MATILNRSRLVAPLTLLLLVSPLGLTGACVRAQTEEPLASHELSLEQTASDQLDRLATEHAQFIMSRYPEWATQMGVSAEIAGAGFKSRLSSYTREENEAIATALKRMISELEAINRSALSDQEKVTFDVLWFAYDLARRQNDLGIGQASILSAGPPYAVNQLFGPQIDLPRLLIAQHPLRNQQDVLDWLERLSEIERVLEELATLTEHDAANGRSPPYFALEAISDSAYAFTNQDFDEHPILVSFAQRLEGIDSLTENQRRVHNNKARSLMESSVYPAYQRFGHRIGTLVPKAGKDAGIWRIENGNEAYEIALQAWGADGLNAEDIHQIGLRDVARLHAQMDEILRSVGYNEGPVGQRMTALFQDPAYIVENTDAAKLELVAKLQLDVDQVLEIAPDWFDAIPEYDVQVRRIPIHEQDSAAGGYYTPPPLDGSRPGIFWVNLKDSADVPTFTLRSLVFHEAVPGHHFQAGASLSIPRLPLIQNLMWFGDYGEGWALYAEELAYEMGLYEGDQLGNLGRLRMELYRAARLVVDTGLHHKRWSRETAIDYMVEVTGESRMSITREIERYAVWPGQATSYKLGMIQLQRLRADAEERLGDRFDIKGFHSVLLNGGAMPMPVLAGRVEHWITAQAQESKSDETQGCLSAEGADVLGNIWRNCPA